MKVLFNGRLPLHPRARIRTALNRVGNHLKYRRRLSRMMYEFNRWRSQMAGIEFNPVPSDYCHNGFTGK